MVSDKTKWNENYASHLGCAVEDEFSEELVNHLIQVGEYVYGNKNDEKNRGQDLGPKRAGFGSSKINLENRSLHCNRSNGDNHTKVYKHFLKTINQAKANKQNITIYRKKNTYVLLLKKCDLSLELGQINDSTFKRTIEKAFLDRLDKSESAS